MQMRQRFGQHSDLLFAPLDIAVQHVATLLQLLPLLCGGNDVVGLRLLLLVRLAQLACNRLVLLLELLHLDLALAQVQGQRVTLLVRGLLLSLLDVPVQFYLLLALLHTQRQLQFPGNEIANRFKHKSFQKIPKQAQTTTNKNTKPQRAI